MKKTVRFVVSAVVILVLMLGSMAMAPAGVSSAGSQKYFVVQFAGPIEDAWKNAVTAEGGEILDYIPDFAFKVRMNPGIANRVAQLGFVSAVTPFQPEFKFGVDLKRGGDMSLYRIRVERGSDFGHVRALVAQTGAEILSYDGDLMLVAANGTFVDAIAQIDDVASINNFFINELHSNSNLPAANEIGGSLIGANAANARGYNGSTQTVAVADTGLGTGSAATAHRDIPSSRIMAIYNWPGVSDSCWTIVDDGAADVDSGHGTHTAGSVLSSGAPNGVGRGVAPEARLVFQAVENWANMKGLCSIYYTDGYYLPGLPSDLNTMFHQAYTAGARIHSNSWGSAAAGDYTLESVQVDTFVWNNRDMLITFSAGNDGIDANSDGAIDNDSMGAPATAKNVLTVGASENQRTDNYPCDTNLTYSTCAAQGRANSIFTYGRRLPGGAHLHRPFGGQCPADGGILQPRSHG